MTDPDHPARAAQHHHRDAGQGDRDRDIGQCLTCLAVRDGETNAVTASPTPASMSPATLIASGLWNARPSAPNIVLGGGGLGLLVEGLQQPG